MNNLEMARCLESTIRTLRYGCGNHYCKIKPPIGQGTNSSCKCMKDIAFQLRALAEMTKDGEFEVAT